jgi:hypothetical protein
LSRIAKKELPCTAMPQAVVIELPEDKRAEASTMVEACSSAIAEGSCTFELQENAAHAIVRLDENGAHVEVAVGAATKSRDLAFEVQEPLTERYREIGLTIAALYGEAKPPPPQKPIVAPRKETWWRIILQLGVLAGNALDTGSPRLGPFFDAAYRPWKFPLALALGMSGGFRGREQSVGVRWFTLDVGPRLMIPIVQSFSIDLKPSFALQLFSAEALAAGTSEGASRWEAAGALDIDFVLEFGQVALIARARGIAGQATLIRVQSEDVAKDPGLALIGMFGIRLGLWR